MGDFRKSEASLVEDPDAEMWVIGILPQTWLDTLKKEWKQASADERG